MDAVVIAQVVVALVFVGAFVWLIRGPLGQRGRTIRAERNGKPNGPMVASMVAFAVIAVVLIVVRR